MIGKSVYLLAFLAAIAVVVNAVPSPYVGHYVANNTNVSHHLIVGARLPGDYLVLRQAVVKTSSSWQIVTVEQKFAASRYEKITQIRALDRKTDGTGATVRIVKGGPGLSNVTLSFKSIMGYGINFVVELYARR